MRLECSSRPAAAFVAVFMSGAQLAKRSTLIKKEEQEQVVKATRVETATSLLGPVNIPDEEVELGQYL